MTGTNWPRRGVLGGPMLEKLAAPYSPPSLQWQNGTILGWLCHRWTTCLNPNGWGWTWCYKWHIVHPEGEVDVMLVDVVNGCQTDQRTKCPGGRSIWWTFREGKNVRWTFRWWTFRQGTMDHNPSQPIQPMVSLRGECVANINFKTASNPILT